MRHLGLPLVESVGNTCLSLSQLPFMDPSMLLPYDVAATIHVFLSFRRPLRAVEISPSTGYRPTQQEAGQNAPCTTTVMHGSRGRVGGEWERHLLRIFREGEREVPPDDKGSIGTLLCATQVYTEQNWSKEVHLCLSNLLCMYTF